MKPLRMPGFFGYVLITFWFLMTISEARSADLGDGELSLVVEGILSDEGLPADAVVRIDYGNSRIPVDFDALQADVNAVSYSAQSGRFIVRFASVDGIAVVSGEATEMIQVPAPVRAIAPGQLIREDAIGWTDAAKWRADQFIADPAALVGKTARRPLAANAPVRRSDVASPPVIEKGDIVTLIFETPGMRLTNQGIALARAAIGDVVGVRSLTGGATVAGVATGRGFVRAGNAIAHATSEQSSHAH